MAQWAVAFEVYASTNVEVEAETLQDAVDEAEHQICTPSLCHYCGRHLEVGDIGDILEIINIETDEDCTEKFKQLSQTSSL